jgi:apolipoprotein N-acyltransferase
MAKKTPSSPPRAPLATRLREVAPAYALAGVTGVLLFTSCADFDWWWNAWVAFLPLFWLIDRARSAREAQNLAGFAGLVANCGGFYWIIGLLERFAHLPWVAAAFLFVLLSAYQALVFFLFGRVVYDLRKRYPGLPMVVVAPMVMVGFELIVPMVFPWYLAITQGWNIHVIQVADLGGPVAVTFLLMVGNAAIYELAHLRRAGLRPALAGAAVLAAGLLYGHVRIGQIDRRRADAPEIQVGVVQPNVSFDRKGLNRRDLAAEQTADLQKCSAELEAQGAELIVWTESSYPYTISRKATGDTYERHPARIRKGFTVPLFMGAITSQPEDFPFIKKLMPKAAGHFARGKDITVFPYRRPGDDTTYRLGPLICYEDIIPAFGRNLAAYKPHLLVNITNDAWFGATSEPWEHLQLSVLRSVELRTDMVRAVNTGVSAWIDANGRVYHKTYSMDPGYQPLPAGRTTCGVKPDSLADNELAPMRLMEGGHTVYARVGDLFGYLNLAGVAWLWLVRPWTRRRRRKV